MAFVTREMAIKHVRADAGAEDDWFDLHIEAAQDVAVAYLNRQVFATEVDLQAAITDTTAGPYAMVANAATKAAILKTVADLYANRETSALGLVELPLSAKAMLRPFRIIPGV